MLKWLEKKTGLLLFHKRPQCNCTLWRPIKTLPETGEAVLYWMQGGVCIAPAEKFKPLAKQERLKMAEDGYWTDYQKWTPLYWMPIPEAPKEL